MEYSGHSFAFIFAFSFVCLSVFSLIVVTRFGLLIGVIKNAEISDSQLHACQCCEYLDALGNTSSFSHLSIFSMPLTLFQLLSEALQPRKVPSNASYRRGMALENYHAR